MVLYVLEKRLCSFMFRGFIWGAGIIVVELSEERWRVAWLIIGDLLYPEVISAGIIAFLSPTRRLLLDFFSGQSVGPIGLGRDGQSQNKSLFLRLVFILIFNNLMVRSFNR